MTSHTDHSNVLEIITRVLEGDTNDFGILIRKYHESVANFVAASFPSARRVEEIVEDVFVRVFFQLPTFDMERPFWPWLRGIARNVISEHLRREAREAKQRQAYTEHVLLLNAAAATREDSEERERYANALSQCLEKLSAKGKTLVNWFHRDRLTSEQIAVRTKGKSSSIRTALVRLRRQLRECVAREIAGERDSYDNG